VTHKLNQKKHLFRESAIKNLNSIHEVQVALKVTTPGSWLCLFMLLITLGGFVMWSLYGSVSLNVSGRGIIIPSEFLIQAEAYISDNMRDQEEMLTSIKDLLDKKKELYKKHYLTLVDLRQAEKEYMLAKAEYMNPFKNSYFNVKKPFFKMDKKNSQVLDVLVFVEHADGKKITSGMTAFIIPEIISPYQYGYIKGKVYSVSEYPATKEAAFSYLGNMNLVDSFFISGVTYMVKIKLESSNNTKSKLSWTTKKGSPFVIEAGTTVSVKIVNKNCTPFGLLFNPNGNS
jgi:hypothetical protein